MMFVLGEVLNDVAESEMGTLDFLRLKGRRNLLDDACGPPLAIEG